MPAFQARDLAGWTGGTWTREPTGLTGVSTDTRDIKSGNLYVALRGPRFDGHHFIPQAFSLGAAAALAQGERAAAYAALGPILCVNDPLRALGAMAQGYRAALRAQIVAVTGSVGKTTVKEMIADVLATRAPTARTRGNWNNDIGLPLSLLAMEPTQVFGVFELGMNHPGELAPLCDILKPSRGVVTNVGPVHIEFFGHVEDIANEKVAVLRALPPDGVAVLSRDEEWFGRLRSTAPCRVITTSLAGDADYVARPASNGSGRVAVREGASGEWAEFVMPLPGEYIVHDALFAVAIGRSYGMPWNDLARAIQGYVPPAMRWNRQTVRGVEVINDAYNANPMSMRAALKTFGDMPFAGRKWLVLGGMLELGTTERQEHVALGREVAKGKWQGLIAVGPLAAMMADSAGEGGMERDRIVRCADHASAAEALQARVAAGDAVLFKASRGERIERVLEAWGGGAKEIR
jgi:UDP-N-acetylmuramoyl-tripeptide--D-alanyl-D-alanine ligase